MESDGFVHLNVSGTHFTTKISTLMMFKDSTLATLVKQRMSAEEEIFIDRDPVLFSHILNCCRNGKVYKAEQFDISTEMWNDELAYFQLVNPSVPNAIEKPAEKPRKRLGDVVNDINAQKNAKTDSIRDRAEPVIAWMLSQRPLQFFVFVKPPKGMKKPDNIPQEVFDIDLKLMKENAKEWHKIGIDNDLHLNVKNLNIRHINKSIPGGIYYPSGPHDPIPDAVYNTGLAVDIKLFSDL